MATLVKPRAPAAVASAEPDGQIPSPFPAHLFASPPQASATATATNSHPATPGVAESTLAEPENAEILSSLALVQQSCMITLNSLLAPYSAQWRPILPPRRHSAPSGSIGETRTLDSNAVLQTIISNLPTVHGDQAPSSSVPGSDAEHLVQLSDRISLMAHSGLLTNEDNALATALISLLVTANRMFQFNPAASRPKFKQSDWEPSGNVYDSLSETLASLQLRRAANSNGISQPHETPVVAVEKALAWNAIDTELERVLNLCSQRSHDTVSLYSRPESEYLPEYDIEPPSYDPSSSSAKHHLRHSVSTPALHRFSMQSANSEKMRLELDSVTMAIDRLYSLAPQLHEQRVELNPAKRQEMELARVLGAVEKLGDRLDHQRAVLGTSSSQSSLRAKPDKGKRRETDADDFDALMSLIGQTQRVRMPEQRVAFTKSLPKHVEPLPVDMRKRDKFVEQLVENASAGRLASQDATFSRIADRSMLTLPEFIRESNMSRYDDKPLPPAPRSPKQSPPTIAPASPTLSQKVKRKRSFMTRDRSNSAPPRWLNKSPSSSASLLTSDVLYVAEHQENLGNIQIYASLRETRDMSTWSADVLPQGSRASDRLSIRAAESDSIALSLPVLASPGPIEVRAIEGHLEMKVRAHPSSSPLPEPTSLLDASHLTSVSPSSFICASCSLPLVQSSRAISNALSYSDLPSEHWAELIESWMCHSDQKLSGSVTKHGKGGFWPVSGQVLVGGSYLLFGQQVVVTENVKSSNTAKNSGDWESVKCLCGAVLGNHHSSSDDEDTYRFAKYAMRPVSASASIDRPPLSAFIVADMMELVQAHATYRFVIRDEEDGKVRILLWLFNPSLRLAYASPKPYVLSKNGVDHVAKVLFKLIGPSETVSPNALQVTYPDFAQAEHLYYPLAVCHSLAMLLRESSRLYPPSRRTLKGLDMGWLKRA